mmetsp:Transcript_28650/g.73161  ORF Transcript_28650/g.73161 Transcript_28650/m.73161 type:complete len:258 (+) Transcript_28650:503-1276(+)
MRGGRERKGRKWTDAQHRYPLFFSFSTLHSPPPSHTSSFLITGLSLSLPAVSHLSTSAVRCYHQYCTSPSIWLSHCLVIHCQRSSCRTLHSLSPPPLPSPPCWKLRGSALQTPLPPCWRSRQTSPTRARPRRCQTTRTVWLCPIVEVTRKCDQTKGHPRHNYHIRRKPPFRSLLFSIRITSLSAFLLSLPPSPRRRQPRLHLASLWWGYQTPLPQLGPFPASSQLLCVGFLPHPTSPTSQQQYRDHTSHFEQVCRPS